MNAETYWWVDVWRVLIGALALWMSVLIARFAFDRWHEIRRDPASLYEARSPHPLVYASYALALFAMFAFRVAKLGEPVDVRLIVSTVIVATGLVGIMKRLHLAPQRRAKPVDSGP